GMLLDRHDDVEVARLSARDGTAAVTDADARAVADPRWDLHFDVLRLVLDAGAVAHRARVLDLPAAPAARRARAREREHALALFQGAGAVARGPGMRPPGTIARTATRPARCVTRHADGNRHPARGVLERDARRGLEVGAALWCARAAAPPAAPEDPAEQV